MPMRMGTAQPAQRRANSIQWGNFKTDFWMRQPRTFFPQYYCYIGYEKAPYWFWSDQVTPTPMVTPTLWGGGAKGQKGQKDYFSDARIVKNWWEYVFSFHCILHICHYVIISIWAFPLYNIYNYIFPKKSKNFFVEPRLLKLKLLGLNDEYQKKKFHAEVFCCKFW